MFRFPAISQKPDRSDSGRAALITLLIFSVTFAVYAPALGNGFVWDDTALVLRDPFIRSWRLIPEGFGHFLFTDATASDFYRPMQRLLFTFDYAIFALSPWGYHLVSILLHGSAAVALWGLLLEFTGENRRGAWLAGAAAGVWAIHPLHTSAVIYVAGSADLLAALFGFSALKLARSRTSLLLAVLAAFCFLAAMLSKESGAMFLVIWLAWLIAERNWRRLSGWAAAAVVVLGIYLLCRLTAVHEPPPAFDASPSALERALRIAKAIGEYARLTVAPADLHMERTLAQGWIGALQAMAGLIVVAGCGGWWRASARVRSLLAGMVLAFLPVSNLFALNAPVAEHWFYVPLAFLSGAVAVAAANFRSKNLTLALAVWAVLLGGRTFVRNFDWKDERTFVERTILAGGDSSRMWMTLSGVEMNEGNLPVARQLAGKALEISPGHPFGLLRLAGIAIQQKKYDEAQRLLDELKGQSFFASQRLVDLAAIAKARQSGQYMDLLRQAVELNPDTWEWQKRYALALAKEGKLAAARERLTGVVGSQPYRAESWVLLARLLAAEGRPEEAGRVFREAKLRDVHLAL